MNDKRTKIKNRIWMVAAFIILFLVFFAVAAVGAGFAVKTEKGYFAFNAVVGWRVAVLAFLSAAVVLSAVYWMLLRPLDELNVAMREVAKGNFSATVKHRSVIPGLRRMEENYVVMTQELSGTEKLQNEFVASVSHEFKTPLAAIEGYATLLKNENLSPEKRREYAERIAKNASVLSKLTGNILQLSRLENQEIVVDKQAFALDEQIRQVLLMLERSWAEKEIELELELPPTEGYGSEELWKTVWINLLSNAFKYTPNGGKVKVRIEKTEENVLVYVEDNGIGMTEEEKKHIFERFYRADASRTTEGYGLGLAIVKRVAELHKAEIAVESVPDHGSKFIVRMSQRQTV